jgi:hypothetical protein
MAAPVDPYSTPGWTCQFLITTYGELPMVVAPEAERVHRTERAPDSTMDVTKQEPNPPKAATKSPR